MASKRDYYEVLGVNKNATDDELKKAAEEAEKKNKINKIKKAYGL